jgi:hypothetical protein
MPETPVSKKQDIAANVSATLIALAAIAAVIYLVLHIVSVLTAVFAVLVGMLGATFLSNTKSLKQLGAKTWFGSKWVWVAILAASVGLFWLRGENALFLIFTLTFLRLFITPGKNK